MGCAWHGVTHSFVCLQVLYSYSIGFIYILTGLLCVGGLGPAVAFCSEVRGTEEEEKNRPDPASFISAVFVLC